MKWYRKAANQGEAHAQVALGVMYEEGQGVPKHYVQAYTLYSLAASRFVASNAEWYATAVKNRDSIALRMTPAQIAEAQRLAREWNPK